MYKKSFGADGSGFAQFFGSSPVIGELEFITQVAKQQPSPTGVFSGSCAEDFGVWR